MWDAVITGGGPAGTTVARLLARWGHRVALVTKPPDQRARAESLPPSTNNLFELLEIRGVIESAGYYTNGGNTSWWTASAPREEHFPPGATGYHVDRRQFDDLLLQLAIKAGVTLTSAPAPARFSIDCSGRAGTNPHRKPDPRYRTAALSAEWNGEWEANPSHALVEAYADGWAWSVPLSPSRRQLAFMVDHGRGRGGLQNAYLTELGKTRVLSRLFAACEMRGEPWACDASLYHSRQYAGPGWLLAGDSASTIDPLSSFGVKKALISAWIAAVVVNTCLTRPEMAEVAIRFYGEREHQTYADHARQAAIQFGELTTRFPTPFWQKRTSLTPELQLYDPVVLERAHRRLRSAKSIRLQLREPLRTERVAAIAGREVVLLDRLVIPGLPQTVEYLQGVNLVQLARIADQHRQVPDLFDAYNKTNSSVALPNFISALSFLLAKGVLRSAV